MGFTVWEFKEKDGLVGMGFKPASGKPIYGRMRLSDLSTFSYIDCGRTIGFESIGVAWPWSAAGDWTICYREARDAKLVELEAAAKAQTQPAIPETAK
jgi:hypothetical protein